MDKVFRALRRRGRAPGGRGDPGDGLRLRARRHDRRADRRGDGKARRDLARTTPGPASSRPGARRSSAIEIAKGGDVEYRDGAWRPGELAALRPGPVRLRRADRASSGWSATRAGEQITVPRHVQTRNVRTTFDAESLAGSARLARRWCRCSAPLRARDANAAAPGARTPRISRLPEGPSEEDRKAARFKVVCEARGSAGARAARLDHGPRRLRADRSGDRPRRRARLLARVQRGRGALAPAQAFDPRGFLAGARAGSTSVGRRATRASAKPGPPRRRRIADARSGRGDRPARRSTSATPRPRAGAARPAASRCSPGSTPPGSDPGDSAPAT